MNPGVQEDAVEFLQLLLDRLNEKIPGTLNLFRGAVKHTSVEIGNEMEDNDGNDEFFVTFPIDRTGPVYYNYRVVV